MKGSYLYRYGPGLETRKSKEYATLCAGLSGKGMKIAIWADSGVDVGMGHLMRCGAIAREAQHLGHDICFFTPSSATSYLISKGFAFSVLSKCKNIENETIMFIDKAKQFGAHCVLVDSYKWTKDCYIRASESVRTVVIDDYARLHYVAQTLVNANIYANELDYSNCAVETMLLGGYYAMLRDEFRNIDPSPFQSKARRILVTMGGADINNYTPIVLDGLSALSGIEIIVVVGPLLQCADAVRYAAKRCRSKVDILFAPKNMAAIMASCDIAISAAGTTTYELCALGIPSILIGQADNQALICNYFQKTNHMKVLGNYSNVKSADISDAVELLICNPNCRKWMRESILALVRRDGVRNIIMSL